MWFRHVLSQVLFCLLVGLPAQSQTLEKVFSLSVSEIGPCALSPNGQTAVWGFRGRTDMLVADVQTGLPLRRLQGHQQAVQFIAFDELHHHLISVAPGEIFVWELPGFRLLERLNPELGKDEPLGNFLYDASRQLLFAASSKEVLVYSLRQKGLGKSFQNREATAPAQLAMAPEGETLWTLYAESGLLQGLSLTHFRPERKVSIPGAEALATDGRRIAVVKRSAQESDYQIMLLDRRLEVLDTFRLEGLFLSGPLPQLQFTGPERLSLANSGEIVELDLKTRAISRFVHGRLPGRLSFLDAGSMAISHRQGVAVIDSYGRLDKQLTNTSELFLFSDTDTGQRLVLNGNVLVDEQGIEKFRLQKNDERPICADMRGAVLAVGTADGELSVYNWKQKSHLYRWKVQGAPYSQIRLLSDSWLAGFSAGRPEWNIVELSSGKLVKKWMLGEARPTAIAVKGAFVYLGDSQGRVSQYGILDTCLEMAHQWLENPVTALAPLSSDEGLAVGSREGIWLCSLPGLKPLRRMLGHDVAVSFLESNADSRLLVSMAGDGAIRLWDLQEGELLEYLELREDFPLAFSFSSNSVGEGLLLTQRGLGIRLSRESFPEPAGIQARGLSAAGNGRAQAPVFNRKGSLLATVDALANLVFIWDAKTLKKLHVLYPGPGLDIRTLAFFGEKEVLLIAGDQVAEYWDPTSGRKQKRIDYRASHLPLNQLQAGSTDLWTLAPRQEQVLRMAPATGDLTGGWPLRSPEQKVPEKLKQLALSPQGSRLAVSGSKGIYWMDTDQKAPWELFVDTLRDAEKEQVELSFSPDGALLACLWKDAGEIALVDLDQGQVRSRLRGEAVAFLDDRRLLVFRSEGMPQPVLDLWDYWKGSPLASFEGFRFAHISAHGADGQIAAATIRGELKLWRLQASPMGNLQLIPVERVEKPASVRKPAKD